MLEIKINITKLKFGQIGSLQTIENFIYSQ